MSGIFLPTLVLILALLGAPLFIVILAAAMVGFLITETPLTVVAIELFRLVNTPLLLALPLFTFAGYVLAESRFAERLVTLARVFFGWMPAGLAVLSLLLCSFFTAFTGASGVTIVALGALLVPALHTAGYPERFSLGLVTTSGSLGLLFAPSLPLILYGVLVQQMDIPNPFTLRELFIAGYLPALLMILLLTLYSIWYTRGGAIERHAFSRKEAMEALWQSRWELPLPVIVLGGIYSGFFRRVRGGRGHRPLCADGGDADHARGQPARPGAADQGVHDHGRWHHADSGRFPRFHQCPGGRRGATACV